MSLKFSTDAFLNTISSEMSKRQLIKPRPAINQKQRLRLLNCVDKFRTLHDPTNSEIIDSLIKKIAKNKKLKNNNKSENFPNFDSYNQDDLILDNKIESLSCLEMSNSSQIMNTEMDKAFRVFYHQNQNNKYYTKKFQEDIDESDDFILAMRIFEESKNANNLMLRLGLSDVGFFSI